jgi:hypothetical protein
VRRAQDGGVQAFRNANVVDELPAARDQTGILAAANHVALMLGHGVTIPPRRDVT